MIFKRLYEQPDGSKSTEQVTPNQKASGWQLTQGAKLTLGLALSYATIITAATLAGGAAEAFNRKALKVDRYPVQH